MLSLSQENSKLFWLSFHFHPGALPVVGINGIPPVATYSHDFPTLKKIALMETTVDDNKDNCKIHPML